ncbi:hypothetical protein ZWY2020_042150 [Hordeum vulgare]|nr:hypothetical protein ZWY2020_042150 [Hordeum vulgare]
MTMTALLSALRGAGRRQITASTVAARQATGSHVLRVDGFTRVREKAANGTAVQSSRFGVGGHDWRIQCYPNGDTEMAEGHLSLYLIHEGQAKTGDATATFKISLLDKAWEPCRSGSQEEHRFDVDHGWGWNKFARDSKIWTRRSTSRMTACPSSATLPSTLGCAPTTTLMGPPRRRSSGQRHRRLICAASHSRRLCGTRRRPT